MNTLSINGVNISYSVDSIGNFSSDYAEMFLQMTQRESVIVIHDMSGGSEPEQMAALKNFCKSSDNGAIIYQYSVEGMQDRDNSGQIKLVASILKMKKADFVDISCFFEDKYTREFLYYANETGIDAYLEISAWWACEVLYDSLKDTNCRKIIKSSISDSLEVVAPLRELLDEIDGEGAKGSGASGGSGASEITAF